MQTKKIDKIFNYFEELFGNDPKCELNYSSDNQLLVAIILSAQCTDVRVNKVTATLFQKYKTINDFAQANITELEREIYSTGFFRNKAKNIIGMAKAVVEQHGGKIPLDINTLVHLSGVGRKTASVFLVEGHQIPAIPVDTHVIRVSRRLGFSTGNNPVQVERDLRKLFDEKNWCKYHLYMVLFGRYHCTAKNPKCNSCKLCGNLCEWEWTNSRGQY